MKFSAAAAVLGLATLAQSQCHKLLHDSNGMMSALCYDELSGRDFEMIDLQENHAVPSTRRGEAALLNTVYTHFANRTLAVQAAAPEKRDTESLTRFFIDCAKKVEGVCASDHFPTWVGTGVSAVGAIFSGLQLMNSREHSSPRDVCKTYHQQDYLCISWASYEVGKAQRDQLQSIADHCWSQCMHKANSCEAKFQNGNKTQFVCVSDRPTGCQSNGELDNCPNIHDRT